MPRGVGGGRRPRRKDAPLSKSQTFRLSASLDEQLRRAAKEAGRSISEEIQFRLELTFRFRHYAAPTIESIQGSIITGPAGRKLLLAISDILRKDHPDLDPLHHAAIESSPGETPEKSEEER